jgi:hypothetical protein
VIVAGGAVTVSVTLTLVDPVAPPAALTRTVPLYEPAPRLPGATVTVSAATPVVGVVPLVGDTDSQLPPLVTCAEKPKLDPPPDTFTIPGDGFMPPTWYEKLNWEGVTVIVDAACTVNVIGMSRVFEIAPALIVTFPV